jgi:hypothetical protein
MVMKTRRIVFTACNYKNLGDVDDDDDDDDYYYYWSRGPPLWSSGQNSWLQIRRSGFDYRHYQKKKVVGLERGALSLVSTTEELLDRKVVAPV